MTGARRWVRLALLGAGLAGQMHARALREATALLAERGVDLEVPVLVDADLGRARQLAARAGIAHVNGSWEDVVASGEVDAVDCCLPDALHAPVALAAVRAGLAVLCEKPLAETPALGAQLVAAAADAGVVTMVGLQYRQTPAARLLRSLIEEGTLGRVHTFHATFERDLGLDARRRVGWRFDPSHPGAGSLHALGPHVIDLARRLVGPIAQVAATVTSDLAQERTTPAASDTADLLLRFASGAHGTLRTSWIAAGVKHHLSLEVGGDRGAARLDSDRLNQVQLATGADADSGFTTRYVTELPAGGSSGWVPGVAVGLGDATLVQLVEFVAAVAEGRPATPSFADGLAVDRCIAAALRASQEGTFVDVEDPVALAVKP